MSMSNVKVCSINTAPFSEDGVLYHWPQGSLFAARAFNVDREKHPAKRLFIRLVLALKGSVTIKLKGKKPVTSKAFLLDLRGEYCSVVAEQGLVTFDFSVCDSRFPVLRAILSDESLLSLPEDDFLPLLQMLQSLEPRSITAEQHAAFLSLFDRVFLNKYLNKDCLLDPRVAQACQYANRQPLGSSSIENAASQLFVSTDRLLRLFKRQLGCTFSEYARTSAMNQFLFNWQPGKNLTELAHQAGFYDSAHFSRTFNSMYGYPPSHVLAWQCTQHLN